MVGVRSVDLSARDPTTSSRADSPLRRPFTGPNDVYCFLLPFRFVCFKIFNPRHNEVSHLRRSPGPLDWDSRTHYAGKRAPYPCKFRERPAEMGGAQGTLSRGDLITQPFSGQSRAIFSQLFW